MNGPLCSICYGEMVDMDVEVDYLTDGGETEHMRFQVVWACPVCDRVPRKRRSIDADADAQTG